MFIYIYEDPFLYLSMEVHHRKFPTGLFDKRDAYPLYINCMSYLDSNIPSKIFNASIGSDILHIARTATTDLINMVKRVNILLIEMKKQGTHIISLLKKRFGKLYFISLQIQLINLFNFFLNNYFCV